MLFSCLLFFEHPPPLVRKFACLAIHHQQPLKLNPSCGPAHILDPQTQYSLTTLPYPAQITPYHTTPFTAGETRKNWQWVAARVCEVSGAGRKTPSQCKMRWERILNPGVKRGLWTKEEDQKLKEVAAAMEYKWSHVSQSPKYLYSPPRCWASHPISSHPTLARFPGQGLLAHAAA